MLTKVANPVPLGLMGFGMTAVLMNLHNMGFYALDSMILAVGLFCGGLCQVMAGMLCYKRGDTFGVTTFTAYGFFWLSQIAILLMPYLGLPETSAVSVGWYLLLWGVFTGFMFIGTIRGAIASQVQFFTLALLYFFLAAGSFMENSALTVLGGLMGVISGVSGIYIAIAQVINSEFGKTVFPLGEKQWFDYNKIAT